MKDMIDELQRVLYQMKISLNLYDIEEKLFADANIPTALLDTLRQIIERVVEATQSDIDNKESYEFKLSTNFDKRFFCAVKVADRAKSLVYDPLYACYYVTYSDDQTREIELSYNVLCNVFNRERGDMKKAQRYLYNHSPGYRLKRELYDHIANEAQKAKKRQPDHPFRILTKQLEEIEKRDRNNLYIAMKAENRIPTKWSSEYKLFFYVHQMCPEALYQYSPKWLGLQSFDIYLPEQRIAIEYQGEQHYIDTGYFHNLEETKARDRRKKELSEENGVRVLEYHYDQYIWSNSVKTFLERNGVNVQYIGITSQVIATDCPGLAIAPVLGRRISDKRK